MFNQPKSESDSDISEFEYQQNIKVKKLIENPEAVLREFADSHLSNTQLEGWEARLQLNIKKRLANDPDKRYLMSLRQSATNMTDEKEKIITAAFLYELEHRGEIKEIQSYNLKALFRLVLDYKKEQEGLLGATMSKYLETVSLEEINKIFNSDKGVKNFDDFPRVAEVAFTRLSTEPEVAKKILETALNELFKPTVNSKNKELKVESFFSQFGYSLNAARFNQEVLEYLINEIKKKDQYFFVELVNEVYKKLKYYYSVKNFGSSSALESIINNSPIISKAYSELLISIKKEEEEKKKQEEINNKKEEEEKAKAALKLEEEKEREDKEKEILFQEKVAKEKEQQNNECDKFLAEIEYFQVDDLIIDSLIQTRVRNADLYRLGELWKTDTWEILKRDEETVPLKLSSLYDEFSRLFHSRIDDDKKKLLDHIFYKKRRELNNSILATLESKRNDILKAIETRFSFDKPEPSIDDFEEYIKELNNILKRHKGAYITSYKDADDLFDSLEEIINRKISEISPVYEKMKSELEENEKYEAFIETQKEYLLKQVELQTEYLQDLYAIGTGLSLIGLESRASDYSGDSIGSVSMGMGQGLSLGHQLKLEHKLEIHVDDEDSLTLEMGEDLDSIKKRMAMVNWVAPHEIAHLVDIASDMSKEIFTEEELIPMRSVIDNWKGGDKDLAEKMIPMIIKETTIDAVGYRILKEYGTANLFDESKTDRIAAALQGYTTTLDVLKNIIQTNTETAEMKSRYSAILLRQIAGGEILIEEARDNSVEPQLIAETQQILEKTRMMFDEFNQETNFVDKSQIGEIIKLCKVYFKKAEQVSIKRRQE